MLFVIKLEILPERHRELIRLVKNPHVPEGVEIENAISLFGKPDILIIFSAKDEDCAMDFSMQFHSLASGWTSLAYPVEKLRWVE